MKTLPEDTYSNSWVITSKDTGLQVFETFQRSVAEKVNLNKYNVETAYQYLCRVNREIKEGSTKYNA